MTATNTCTMSGDSRYAVGWAAGHPEAAQLPEDAIAGRAGILCARASGGGVCGPGRVSLTSWERSVQEG